MFAEQNYIPQFQNGRVTNITENVVERYPLFDGNKPSDSFAREALYGIQECTPLSKLFFSKDNINLVNNMIRYNVYKQSHGKYIIGNQSTIELEIIMRSIYLQHARNLPFKIREQIQELNDIVLKESVPRVLSEVQQYIGYLHRVEQLPQPIELPKNLSTAGTKLLRSVTTTF